MGPRIMKVVTFCDLPDVVLFYTCGAQVLFVPPRSTSRRMQVFALVFGCD